MQTSSAVWAAIALTTVALAGCTGGELDMLVTPAEDPVTEPFHFKATGPSYDHYEWDFGDGVRDEGKEVDHTFGFTNGDIIVQLTAYNEGEDVEPAVIARTVDLGGGRNTNAEGALATSTYWIDPGEVFTANGFGSSDPDGDPLLYRWTCERLGDLIPPDTSHPPHEGLGGVPFGVDDWATLDVNLSLEGIDLGDDLCGELDPSNVRPWTTAETAIQGSITESGVYAIEMLVRDPKGTPWTGRLNLYVSEPDLLKPDPNYSLELSGTMQFGSGGSIQERWDNDIPISEDGSVSIPAPGTACEGQDQGPCENQDYDRIEVPFEVVMPSLTGTIEFSYEGGTADDSNSVVQYQVITADSGSTAIGSRSGNFELIKDTLTSNLDGTPREYIVVFTLTNGAQVDFNWNLQMEHDIDPINWYERL